MKIAILTQPLQNNYGGLLQAFALQKYLKEQGNEVMTVDFAWNHNLRYFGIKSILVNILRKYILRRNIRSIIPITNEERRRIGQNTDRFTAEHIRTTQKIYSVDEISHIKKYQFDAYIIGSDQVWRPAYSPGMSAFFLSFLNKSDDAKRIAYAASFGVDNCNEFSQEALKKYSVLLKQFDAVAVREDSAVDLCKQHFDVAAEHVLDPTFLLDKETYSQLVEQDKCPASNGNMMVYVLDQSLDKKEVIQAVANERSLIPYSIMPDEKGVYPPVTQWLRGFMDAEYVVTDSFHGVAFSVIFNKPFIAIGNYDRGLARFTSVLKMFGLQERLIFSINELTSQLINQPIDYSKVNRLKIDKQMFAMDFLNNALSGK